MPTHRLTFTRAAWTAFALLTVAAPVALWAQSDESDRRRAVGDWLVEDVAEDESRVIHIRREEGDYSVDYHLWLDPGVGRIGAQGFLVGRFNCARGGEESVEPDAVEAAATRRRIEEYLERCEAPPAEVASLLPGYDRAFALARQWAEERLAEMASANAAADAMTAADNSLDVAGSTDLNSADAIDMSVDAGSAYENRMGDMVANTTADPE